MKILYHHRIASFDGQAVHIQEMVHALRAGGCQVQVIGPSVLQGLKVGTTLPAIRRLKRYVPGFLYEFLELAYAVPTFVRLLWVWARFRPDVIYERYNLLQRGGLAPAKSRHTATA